MDVIHDEFEGITKLDADFNLNTQAKSIKPQNEFRIRRRECKSTSDDSCTFDLPRSLIFSNSLLQSKNDDPNRLVDGKFGSNALNIVKSVHVSPSSFTKLKHSKEKRVKRLSSNSILIDNSKKQNYKQKLFHAVSLNDYKTVLELLQTTNVDVNCYDDKQRTALHISSSKGNIDIVRILLEHGSDPNLRDCVHNLPIHLAIICSHVPIVTLLLEAGTDIESLDLHGKTVLHLAGTRLRWLLNDDNQKATPKLKLEAIQIMHMIKQYLKSKKQSTDDLDVLSNQFESAVSIGDINDLTSLLLNKFESFNISTSSL